MTESSGSPFERRSSEVLVDNPWHRYCHDRYLLTNGEEGSYYYVDMPGSCGIIPRFEDGRTVLLSVERYLLGRKLIEFPIGGMRSGEDALLVAQKELREEAGLLAGRWTKLGSFAPYKGVSNEHCHFFLAEDLSWTEQELEASESIERLLLPFDEARERLLGQELGDGQSMAGLLLYERFLNSGSADPSDRGGRA